MDKLFNLAKQKDADIEIYKITTTSTIASVRNKNIDAVDTLSETGFSLRIIKNKKLGFAYTTDLDESALEYMFEQALIATVNTNEDEFCSIPGPLKYEPLITYNRDIASLKTEDKINLALSIEEAAYAYSPEIKKTEKVTFQTEENKIEILNSKGINIVYHANNCGGTCDVIAEDNNERESGSSLNFVSNFSDFIAQDVGKEAAMRACELLNAKTVAAQKLSLVLTPFVGAQLLSIVSSLFSSDAVQKGKSLFAQKLNQQVASKLITIIDDGRLKNGLKSSGTDDEGVPSQKTVLVENGILSKYLYNTYTARKENKLSTGSGRRFSYKTLPEVAPSNIFIAAGRDTPNSLAARTSKGLQVTRAMGIHTINPISGDFSIGATGIMIENGEKTYPVRGITIAGNLIDLLKSVEAIASDLRFFPLQANVGCPTLLIQCVAVSG